MYGYRYGMRFGPKLAKACIINLEVKWLINDLRPSIRTINYFRANKAKATINDTNEELLSIDCSIDIDKL